MNLTEKKRIDLTMLKSAGYKVPTFGKCSLLELCQPKAAKVLVMRSPLLCMSLGEAAAAHPHEYAMMLVGKQGAKCMRVVQVGTICVQIRYENPASWRAEDGKMVDKWLVGDATKPAFSGLDCYSIDFVDMHAVNLKTRVGLTSLKIFDLISRAAAARQFRQA